MEVYVVGAFIQKISVPNGRTTCRPIYWIRIPKSYGDTKMVRTSIRYHYGDAETGHSARGHKV